MSDKQPPAENTEIPDFMKVNPYIKTGYRINYSLAKLFRSLFTWHNQTMNVWTHLIPALFVFALILSSSLYFQQYRSRSQLRAFIPQLEEQQINLKTYKYSNFSQQVYDDRENTLFQSIVYQFLTPVTRIKILTEQVLALTRQDNLSIREQIFKENENVVKIIQKINGLALLLTKQNKNTQNINSNIYQKLLEFQAQLSVIIQKIKFLIDQMALQVNPVPKWPILIFYISVSTCFTFSAIYHLLYPFGFRTYRLLSSLDFAGIIILIIGSSFPPFIYGSECNGILSVIYLPAITIVGSILFIALVLGYFRGRQNKTLRLLVFSGFGLLYLIPITHAVIIQNYYDNYGDPLKFSDFIGRYLSLAPVYIGGVIVLNHKCPQRYYPQRFDICGSSHQLWHLFSVAGVVITYFTNWDFYYNRRICPCPVY